jgi:hypothetical protein
MSYTRPPNVVLAGQALIQSPPPSPTNPAGILPVTLDCAIATTSSLGVVKVGSGLSITPTGILSSTGSATIGAWTPSIVVANAGTITITSTTRNYSKVGQQVTCYFDFTVSTKAGGANLNALSLHGLPFTSIAGTGFVGNLVMSYWSGLNTDKTTVTGTVGGSSTISQLWDVHQSELMSTLTYQDLRVGSRLVGTISYLSAS